MAIIEKTRRRFGPILGIHRRVSVGLGILGFVVMTEAAMGQIRQILS